MDKYGESYFWILQKIHQIAEKRKELNVRIILLFEIYCNNFAYEFGHYTA